MKTATGPSMKGPGTRHRRGAKANLSDNLSICLSLPPPFCLFDHPSHIFPCSPHVSPLALVAQRSGWPCLGREAEPASGLFVNM